MQAIRVNPDLTRKSYTPTITQGDYGTVTVLSAYEYHDFIILNVTFRPSQAITVGSGFKIMTIGGSSNGGILSSDRLGGVVTLSGTVWVTAIQAIPTNASPSATVLLFK